MPELPNAGPNVAHEIEIACRTEKTLTTGEVSVDYEEKCHFLNMWLNDIFLFKIEYVIYREDG